ncbi:hypothetical protein PLESTB_000330000 [Pleodorina starrii]|uniref:Ankyrin repeat domain-containing protein n=1 Tax=Pleodorina starrii TaxID=330485 RepID=A0A9W6BEE8_9CHLO|nr:hypothetical protein PLESTB_000330000 [Pleodorina starrii]GLC75116.1 hypothetical protein PLESTF_001595600 [Pleodorina starrii]
MSQSVTHRTPDGSIIWLPGIVSCIAHHLPANEVASTLRLIDKTTSQQFAHHKTLRLSLPSPIHVFRERWGRPGAFRAMSHKQRLQLLCLTAASGSIANLEVALANAGLDLRCELLEAAAAAGQLDMCKVLHARGCPWGDSLSAAAKAGHRRVCEWMLASGCPLYEDVVWSAAGGGREDLMQWLLTELLGRPNYVVYVHCWSLLAAAAGYLSLAALQRLWQQLMSGHHGSELQQHLDQLKQALRGAILAAAAGSTTPDWQAKVEWLEGLGYPRMASACTSALRAGDGDAVVARLQWLRGRGYPLDAGVADDAVDLGNVAALRFLVEQAGVRPFGEPFRGCSMNSARRGHLAVLQYLHASGLPINTRIVAEEAARAGHLPIVSWAVEGLGVAPADDGADSLLDCAAESGNLELMTWLYVRGWALGPTAITNGAKSGCEEALEWLVERGCPFPLDGGAYLGAARNGDLAMLRCLGRLGCPWGPPGKLLADCIRFEVSVAVLQCLLDLDCPEPDWDAAVKVVEDWRQLDPWERHAALLAWLGEQRQRRSPGAQGA